MLQRFSRLSILVFAALFVSSFQIEASTEKQERPLDLSENVIRKAVRAVERERMQGTPFVPRATRSGVARLRVFTVDTRNEAECANVQAELQQLKPVREEDLASTLCNSSEHEPLTSVILIDDVDTIEFRREIDHRMLISADKTLANDTRNLAIGMGGAMGILWILPESISKWDKKKIRDNPNSIFDQYKENVKQRPIWDKDDPLVNYVGHPLSGAAFYTLARHDGKSPLESFGYSFAMSTFFWEYGFEALAERPSIQDLIVTPVIGAVLGEYFFRLEKKIIANDGKLWDSKRLGKIAMIVLNPAGALSNAINRAAGSKVVQNSRADVVARRTRNLIGGESNLIGLQLSFQFNAL